MKRKIIGFLVAPLVAVLVFLVSCSLESIYWWVVGVEKLDDPSGEVLFFSVLVIGVPLAYGLALIVGLPLVLISYHYRILSLPSFAVSGALVGIVFGLAVWFFIATDSIFMLPVLVMVGAVCCVSAATSFWYISVRERNGSE